MSFRRIVFALGAIALAACGTLQVGIEPPTPQAAPPSPTATSSSASPATAVTLTVGPPERITFPVGSTTFTFTTRLNPGAAERYVLQILAMQKMTVTTSSNAAVQVFDAQSHLLAPASTGPNLWQGVIPETGDYIIVLQGNGLLTVSINIPPLG